MEYYIIVNDQQQGPFGLEQLAERGLTPETEVWAEGMSDWTRAGDVPELLTYFSAFPAWVAFAESRQPGASRPVPPPRREQTWQPAAPEQKPQGKSHTALWGVLIALAVVVLVLIITCPSSNDHRDAVTAATQEFVDDKVDEASNDMGSDFLSSLLKQGSKWLSGRAIDVFLDNNFRVDNYFVCSVGKVKFDGREQTVSLGLLNHVFTFDKTDLAEAVAKVGKAEQEAEEASKDEPDVQTLPSPEEAVDDVLSDEKQALDTIAKGVKDAVVKSAKDWINKKIDKLTKQLPDTLP